MAINDEEVKNLESEQTSEVVIEEEQEDASVASEEVVVDDAKLVADKTNTKKAKNKKPSKIKALFSELKKVTWPSFGSVVKKTAVVLCVTLFFLVIIFGFDSLLNFLTGLLTQNM